MRAANAAVPRQVSVEDVLERVRPRLEAVLRRYRVPPTDGEDLLQQVLVLMIHRWSSIESPDRWMVGTLRHHCLMYWRSRRRSLHQAVDQDLLEWLASPVAAPQERADFLRDVEKALARLPQKYQEVIRLRYALGYRSEEVAERLGYQRSSIGKVTSRCLAALSRELEGGDEDACA